MSAVAQPDEEAPYPVRAACQRCLTGSTDKLLVRQVEAYVAANPAGSKGPMVAVIIKALFDLCRSEIEKAQSPNGGDKLRAKLIRDAMGSECQWHRYSVRCVAGAPAREK